jgi:hypothetical protein
VSYLVVPRDRWLKPELIEAMRKQAFEEDDDESFESTP